MEEKTKISILPATIADVPAIRSFIQQLADYEKLSHEVFVTEDLLREHLFGPRPVAEAIIARLSGTPVGFALFFSRYSTFSGKPGIWLEDLFVVPAHRGKGVGMALIRKVAEITLERNCDHLEWTVLDWNAPAITFYKKLGAFAMSDWTTQRMAGPELDRLAGKS